MRIKKRFIIIGIIVAIILVVGGIILFRNMNNKNNLSNDEKKWLDNNSNKVLSIVVPNDIPVFGSTGAGVFFDFVDYLSSDLNLKINKNTVSYVSESSGYGFEISNKYDKDKLLMYKDHYILVSKNTGILYDPKQIPSLNVGIINSSLDLVKDYYNVGDEAFKTYSTYGEINTALGDGTLQYALVPLNEYIDGE